MKKGRRQQAGCRTRNLTLITFVSLILIAILTGASYGAQIRRIAWLSSAVYHLAETVRPGALLAFTDGLRELGWIEKVNIALKTWLADEKFDQTPELNQAIRRISAPK